ncbi:RagB/SusD family nutrient uptake outer membrane protein [Christiangramia crocea]|uniref:RagB/SusD family nutrient uptake outer membrane protein n=1 Tax=Christiangramia crocea TaxID=2904124 RepID=A0A9X1UX71_9FLAO|nr:RagB/SusD family nutrient uptake outer membrane protein [Gramella crocea]MCG9971800.1 RagB/SusD family nutrient uptake outer membrane protein [Gramella crocea]
MRKIYNSIWLLALTLLFTGCDDKLDLEPRQEISAGTAISTGENVKNILIGVYNETAQDDSYGGYLQLMADLYGFTDQATWGGTFQQPRQVFNKSIFVDNSFVRDLWLNGYEAINQANLVLDYADLVDEEEREIVMGEAYFLRALNYFDLNRFFSSPDNSLGVPLTLDGITDYSQNLEIERAPADQVYTQVVSDLEKAIQFLPASNGIFADQYSAQALLARVQLHLGNYEAARDAADGVIENSGHSLTGMYSEAFNNDEDSSEDVFAFQVTSQDGENLLVVHYADQSNGGRGGDVTVNEEYLNMFGDSDDRGSFFYTSAQNGGTLTSKYTNQFGNIPLIRLAEMYLIRAEANERLGTDVGATPLEDVNVVRERANAGLLSEVTLDDILRERELELMFEGFLIFDYTRTGRSVGEIPADSPRLSFPIPQREIDANPLLVPNPGYGS